MLLPPVIPLWSCLRLLSAPCWLSCFVLQLCFCVCVCVCFRELPSIWLRWRKFDLSFDLDCFSLPSIFNFRNRTKDIICGRSKPIIFWLVLPSHANHDARGVSKVLADLHAHWGQTLGRLVGDFLIKVSYKSFYPSLAARCNRHNSCLARWEWRMQECCFCSSIGLF